MTINTKLCHPSLQNLLQGDGGYFRNDGTSGVSVPIDKEIEVKDENG